MALDGKRGSGDGRVLAGVGAAHPAAGQCVGEREEVLAPRATLGHGGERNLSLGVGAFRRADAPRPARSRGRPG